MKRVAVILAGGEGHRAGGAMPKQFVDLRGLPVVWWAVRAFLEENPETEIVLVLHPGFFDDWNIIYSGLPECAKHPCHVCCGGVDRRASVYNGLTMARQIVTEKYGEEVVAETLVAIHDGARPLVTPELIRRGFEASCRGCGLVPAVHSVNSLRYIDHPESPFGNPDSHAVERRHYMDVQTPHIFFLDDIIAIHDSSPADGIFTDDASMAESRGREVILYEGSSENIKITHPVDFAVVNAILENRISH